jgi:hypothetical protein
VRHHSDIPCGCSEADVRGVLGFLVDGVCVVFGDRVFRRSVGIPVGTGCAPLLADLFLYSYGAGFVRRLLRDNGRGLAVSFSRAFGCIDDVLSVGNHGFRSCVRLVCPDGLEVGGTTGSDGSASCLGVLLGVDSGGGLAASLYDRRGGFGFAVVGFPFLCGGMPLSPACGVCVSRLVRCAGACFAYGDFSERGGLLAEGLMLRGCGGSRFGSSFRGFCGRCGDLVCDYKLSLAYVLNGLFRAVCWAVVSVLALAAGGTVYLFSTVGSTAGVAGRRGMLAPSRRLVLPSRLSRVRVALRSIL